MFSHSAHGTGADVVGKMIDAELKVGLALLIVGVAIIGILLLLGWWLT